MEEILRAVSKGSTPVNNGSYQRKLSKEYRKETGKSFANMELEGDMLDSLTFKRRKGSDLEIGIFKSSEVPKADGHNNFSGDSNLPLREFIPKESQEFKRSIEKGIKDIVKDFEEEPKRRKTTPVTIQEDAESVAIGINDLFSEDFLTAFLRSEGLI